jgi:mRNA interferase MazF
VLSPRVYNERSGLAVACPITSKVKGYMFEVPLPPGGTVAGVILADLVRSIDWRERRVTPAGRIDQTTLDEVRARIRPLLGL